MLDFTNFQTIASKVPCCMTRPHSPFLYSLVKWLSPQTVVEVGAWQGGVSVWLARALQELGNSGRLCCIDDFGKHKQTVQTTVGALYSNLCDCGVEDVVDILYGKSQEVEWPSQVDCAFIDGDHKFEMCAWDVNQAISRGASCVIVHDTFSTYGTAGPRKWLNKFRKEMKAWGVIEVPFCEGLAIVIKNPSHSPAKIS